jgi:hypothetical protein
MRLPREMCRSISAGGGYDVLMRSHIRTTPVAALLFSMCFILPSAHSDPATTAPADRPALAATVKVTLDPRAAADYGVDPHQVDAAVADFEARHDAFTLTDLQNLKVPAGSDKSLLLSEIATIDVQFSHLAEK